MKTLIEKIETLENPEAVLAIEKIIRLETEFPGIIKVRMLDHLEVLADSARKGKYPLNNWLEPNGRGCDNKSNHASICRHIADEMAGSGIDQDSGRPSRLHASCRLMMKHTRESEGLYHPDDVEKYAEDLHELLKSTDKTIDLESKL